MLEIAPTPITAVLLADDVRIGEELQREMQAAAPEIDARCTASMDEFRTWIAEQRRQPDIAILSASFPQSWNADELADFWNLLPSARWIIVLNGLTASAWRHVPALPAGSLVPRERFCLMLHNELSVLRGEREPLVWTASAEEIAQSQSQFTQEFDLAGARVGFFSADRDLKGWWRDLIVAFGGEVVSLDQHPNVVLWDLDPAQVERTHQLMLFHRAFPDCRVLGLRNSVNDQTRSESLAAGVHQLLPKLCGAELILEAIAAMNASAS